MLCEDNWKRTFFYYLCERHSSEKVKQVLFVLPYETAAKLSALEGTDGRTPQFWCKFDLNEAIEVYTVSSKVYQLKTAPRCLIFYSTVGRDDTHAKEEKDSIIQYCEEKSILYKVVTDPTEDTVYSSLKAAQSDENLSALVVFILSHGQKGIISVAGDPNYVVVESIITHMCLGTEGKPKVCDL